MVAASKLQESKNEVFTIGQNVYWKGEGYNGVVKWVTLSGTIVGVDFEQELHENAPGFDPYASEFFDFRKGHGRILPSHVLESAELEVEKKIIEVNNNNTYCSVTKNGHKKTPRGKPNLNHVGKKNGLNKNKIRKLQSSINIPKRLLKPSINFAYLSGGRGIEWANNSCYLDSTLFALFYTTNVFDNTIFPPVKAIENLEQEQNETNNNEIAIQTRTILKNEIIFPLRKYLHCSGENVAKLRKVLSHFNKKLIGSFMDAEDLLFILLEQALKLKEFIVYSNGVQDFLHQLIIDCTVKGSIESVQHLFKTSMSLLDHNLKLRKIPEPALMIEMPRSDGVLIGYKAIIPNLTLDITDLMSSGDCLCGNPATWTCPQCIELYDKLGIGCSKWTSFCEFEATEHKLHFDDHELILLSKYNETHRITLELISVICVKSSHYVAFTKCGEERLSPWLFLNSFDKVVPVENLGMWLEMFEMNLNDQTQLARLLSECPMEVRRILLDAHICIYGKR